MIILMDDLDFFRVYLGNFLIVAPGSFGEHLAKVQKVIKKIQSAGIKYNIDKLKFAVP